MDDIEIDMFGNGKDLENNNSNGSIAAAALRELRLVSKAVKSRKEENALIEEWKIMADLFNKFFFYLSIAVQIMMAVICFVILPTVKR